MAFRFTDHFASRPLKLLSLAATFIVADGLLTSPAMAQAPPDLIIMPGIVRDFRQDHTDFDVTPAGGYGHYTGNIGLTINADQTPAFVNGGFRVNTQWTNKTFQNIAPHLFIDSLSVPLGMAPILDAGATANSWDSSLGQYSMQMPGPAPNYNIGALMPPLSEPSPFVANVGDVQFRYSQNGNPQNTITADIHCDNFSSQQDTIMVIDGNVTILCEQDFNPNQRSHIRLTPGSTLNIYFKELFKINQQSSINMPAVDPSVVNIYNLGTTQMEINQGSAVCAIIYSPNAPLHLAQDDQFFGKFIGASLRQDQNSGFHWDMAPWRDQCANSIEDIAGAAGGGSAGGITSAATFDEWYHDVLGVNLSQIHLIEMVRNGGTGIYEADIPGFHPIDDRLYGNEGEAHNYFFTYEFTAQFTYVACQNYFFEFQGSDDAWMFIDDKLVMDLGGVIPGVDQIVDLDRLGLTDGNSYTFTFFYAQRQGTVSDFNLRTNAVLLPPVLTATGTAGFD